MKLLFFIFCSFNCFVPLLASADTSTPWERYLEVPTSDHATQVQRVEYSVANENLADRLEHDLSILEYEVTAGEAASINLAFRIRVQMASSVAIAEFMDSIIGRSIRSNPKAYLRALASYNHNDNFCVGASPSGDLFVDREAAAASERQARAAALKNVTDYSLRKIRDQCVLFLQYTKN